MNNEQVINFLKWVREVSQRYDDDGLHYCKHLEGRENVAQVYFTDENLLLIYKKINNIN